MKRFLFTITLALCAACLSAPVKPEGGVPGHSDLEDLVWPGAGTPPRLDQRGRPLSAGALRDKVVVVSFVAADCSVVCIVRVRDLDAVARALPEALRESTAFLTVATGDAGDVARLRGFAESVVGAASPLRFVTNDAEGTARLATMLRYPASALPEPPPRILLFDRRGQIAMTYDGAPVDRPRLSRDIALLRSFENGLDATQGRTAEASPKL